MALRLKLSRFVKVWAIAGGLLAVVVIAIALGGYFKSDDSISMVSAAPVDTSCKYVIPVSGPHYSQANIVVVKSGTVTLAHRVNKTYTDELKLAPGTHDLTARHSDSAERHDKSPDRLYDWANWALALKLQDGTTVDLYNDDKNTNPAVADPSGLTLALTCTSGKVAVAATL